MDLIKIIIILFILVLLFIIFRYFFYNQNTISTLKDAKVLSIVGASQLPTTSTGSVATNYTYSVWIYINSWNYRYGEYKIILGRMGSKTSTDASSGIDGIYGANPCPILVLGAIENTATCAITCYGAVNDNGETANTDKTIFKSEISNIPLQNWVNLLFVVNNTSLDFYMNGKLVKSSLLPGTAYVDSTTDLYITPNGGFDGYTANVQYWPAPKNTEEVWNIYQTGYKNNLFGNLFNSYTVEVNVEQNGIKQGSITI